MEKEKWLGDDWKKPLEIRLTPYRAGLRTVEVELSGKQYPFLFDTGGGVTAIIPELADRLGCTPFGRVSGFRLTGERLDFRQCGEMKLGIGPIKMEIDTFVKDLNTMLPDGWPKIYGIISLHTFQDRPITIDLAAGRLVIDTEETLQERTSSMNELSMQVERTAEGRAVDVYIEARAKQGSLWLQLDSGNVKGFLLAPHALEQLGLSGYTTSGHSNPGMHAPLEIPLEIIGLGTVTPLVEIEEMIHDGNAGAGFMEQMIFTIDIRSGRIWAKMHGARRKPPTGI